MLRRNAAQRQPDFTTLGALAVLEAERGQVTEAERLFTRARSRYRGISPFPVASLDFRHGLMWLGRRDLTAARAWFDAAVRRVPAYAPAQGHLAEVDAALGAAGAAIDRLRPLAVSSDDPEYAAILAGVLDDAGRPVEAEHWRAIAATRYEELASRYPEAFADHAADFWRTVGGDPQRALAAPRTGHGHSSQGYAGVSPKNAGEGVTVTSGNRDLHDLSGKWSSSPEPRAASDGPRRCIRRARRERVHRRLFAAWFCA